MKKIILSLFIVAASSLFLASCSEVKTDVKNLEGKWNITKLKGEEIFVSGLPNINFDMNNKKVNGNAGCNIFNSTIELDSTDVSKITINPAATTMMACPDMDKETKLLQSFGEVKSVKAGATQDEILLCDADGNVLITLTK